MRRRTFMEAFDPYLQDATNLASRYFLQQGEEEKQRQETQRQNDILSQLLSDKTKETRLPTIRRKNKDPFISAQQDENGNPIFYGDPKYNKIEAYLNSFEIIPPSQKMSQEEKLRLLSGASKDTLDKYKFIEGLNQKPKINYYQYNGNVYKKNDDGSIDFNNPIVTGEQKTKTIEESEFVDANTIQGLERFKGYTVERKVIKDDKGNFLRYGNIGNPFKPATITRKGSNGEDNTVYNLDKYKETFGVFNAKETDLEVKMGKYLLKNPDGIDIEGNALNKDMDNAEITFYNKMLPDAKNYVNKNFYDQVKDSGFDEYRDRKQLLDAYLGDLDEDYINGNLEINLDQYDKPEGVSDEEFKRQVMSEVYKSAKLWGKLKMKRL